MKQLRCSKPSCGNTFGEGTPEFEDGFCSCGAALIEVNNEDLETKPIEEIINGDTITPRFDHEVIGQKPVEKQHVADFESTLEEGLPIPTSEELDEDEQQKPLVVEEEQPFEEKQVVEQENISEKTEELEDPNLPIYLVGKNNEIIYKQDESYPVVYESLAEQGFFGDPNSDYEGDRIQFILNGQVLRTYPLEFDEFLIGRAHDGIVPDIDYTDIDVNRYISRRHALIYRQQNEYFIRNLSTKNSVHVNKEVLKEKEFRCLQDGDRIALSRKFGLVFKKKSESEHI